jgi:hypothetical protein
MTINYSKQVLLKRGNTAVSSTYVGPIGEVTYDTDLYQLRVHDGERAGGWLVPGGPEYDLLLPLIGNAATQQTQINSLFANAAVQQTLIANLVNQGNTDPATDNETFWFNTEDGRLYIKWEDMWVDSSPTILPSPGYITDIMSDFAGNIVPAANVTYSLGTQQAQWKDLWVSNNTIYIGNTPITVSNGSLLVGGNVVSGSGGDRLVNDSLELVLDRSGTLQTPLLLPVTFTAVLDSEHMVQGVGLTDEPWEFEVQFQVGPDGEVVSYIGNNTPFFVNPGYVDGYEFEYTETDHGIPSYTFTITLNDVVQAGPAGWTTNLAVTQPPEYPSTIESSGAIKLTSNDNSWTFGTSGNLTLPAGGKINDANGRSILSNQNLNTTDAATFANVSATIGFISQINGTNPGGELVIQTDGTHNWIFDANGTTTFPGGGHISATKGGTALDAGYGYNTSLTTFYANANYAACVTGDAQTGTLNITAYNDGGPNPSRVWSFDKTGNLTLPAGGDILDSTGASVLGGGGAADTGNIVFSGSSMGLDEGSAEAADTYINISPNGEGWAYLQLPNDTSANITDTRLWNAAGNVEIGTGDFSNLGESYTWNFNKDGSLTFPGGNITIASNILGSGTDAMLGSANAAVGVIAQGESGSIGLQWSDTGVDVGLGSNIAGVVVNSPGGSTPGTVHIVTGVIGSQYTWEFGADGNLTVPSNIGSTQASGLTVGSNYNVRIVADQTDSDHTWTFGTDGSLTMPNGAKIGLGDAYQFATDNTVVTAVDMRDTSGRGFYTDSNGYTLRSSGEKNWGFGTTGILTLPSNSYVETTDANLTVGSQGTVTIRANAATVGGTRAWTFGTNGATTFPGNISVPGNLSTIAGFAFYNGDPILIVATATIWALSFANPYYIEIAKNGLPAGFDTLLGSGAWTATANGITLTVVSVVSNGDYWRITVAENPNGTISTIATFNRAASGANIVIPAGGNVVTSSGSMYSIRLAQLKSIVASSATWGEFQANIAAL